MSRSSRTKRGRGFEFTSEVVGGSIPRNFIPAVEKGCVEGMQAGVVAGYPVVDVHAIVYDGSYHDVDSNEISFKIAGLHAFKEAMQKARPALLEPIMNVTVYVPDQYMGDITGDLNHRRGHILTVESADGCKPSRRRCRRPNCSNMRANCAPLRRVEPRSRWSSRITNKSPNTSPKKSRHRSPGRQENRIEELILRNFRNAVNNPAIRASI